MQRILVVDDEPQVLTAVQRLLASDYDVAAVSSSQAALQAIERATRPFAVIVADLVMPAGDDGVTFLGQAAKLTPDSVRIVLTGRADLERAIKAINTGQIFRFLLKPCPSSDLRAAVQAAVHQYGLVTAERELLDRTLNGAVAALVEAMAIADPLRFAASMRRAAIVDELLEIELPDETWDVRLAAMLSTFGSVAVPEAVVRRAEERRALDPEERALLDEARTVVARVINGIPRLQNAAQFVAEANNRFGADDVFPRSLGGQMVRFAIDLDAIEGRGVSRHEALAILGRQDDRYPESWFRGMHARRTPASGETREVGVDDLVAGMVFTQDVRDRDGNLFAGRGQRVTEMLLLRFRNSVLPGTMPPTVARCPGPDQGAGALLGGSR